MRPEAKKQFDLAAEVLNVDPATRDKMWQQMTALGLTPDDPTAVHLALSGKLELAINSFNDIPAKIEAASKAAVGPVAHAAESTLKARVAEQQSHTEAAFRQVLGNFDTRSKKLFSQTQEKILQLAEMRMASAERAELLKGWAQAAGAVCIAIILAGAIWGWLMFSTGKAAGETNVQAINATAVELLNRPDAATILRYMENNNFDNQTRAFCGSGSSMLVTVEGARRCGPFWYDAPPTAEQNPLGIVPFFNSLNAPFRRFEPLLIIAVSLFGGFAIGRWFKRKKPY